MSHLRHPHQGATKETRRPRSDPLRDAIRDGRLHPLTPPTPLHSTSACMLIRVSQADPNGQSHATRNANTARHWEAMAMSKEQGLADDELERIRHMAESRPAKVRFTGGMFTSGPLRGVRVDGAPSFFNESDGSIKKNFRWVTSARMQKRSRRSTRRPRIAPYSNTRFLPTDAEINQGFVEIKCNVFNHGKYKH